MNAPTDKSDTQADTSANRGLDLRACRKLVYESGFTGLLRGDRSAIKLDLPYLLDAKKGP